MPCVTASAEVIGELSRIVDAAPETELTIDVEAKAVRCAGQQFPVEMVASAREGLLKGEWDPIALMLDQPEVIDGVAQRLHYI